MTLQREIREFAAKHESFCHGDRILVAVSGGPDSVALLHLLHELRKDYTLNLEMAQLALI